MHYQVLFFGLLAVGLPVPFLMSVRWGQPKASGGRAEVMRGIGEQVAAEALGVARAEPMICQGPCPECGAEHLPIPAAEAHLSADGPWWRVVSRCRACGAVIVSRPVDEEYRAALVAYGVSPESDLEALLSVFR